MTTATSITDQFRTAYADALKHSTGTPDEMRRRNLNWQGDRISLTEAAQMYALVPGYNEYSGEMLGELLEAFPEAGIEVTPGRESSVVVYLHIKPDLKAEVLAWIVNNWSADEHDWENNGTLRVWWD